MSLIASDWRWSDLKFIAIAAIHFLFKIVHGSVRDQTIETFLIHRNQQTVIFALAIKCDAIPLTNEFCQVVESETRSLGLGGALTP